MDMDPQVSILREIDPDLLEEVCMESDPKVAELRMAVALREAWRRRCDSILQISSTK